MEILNYNQSLNINNEKNNKLATLPPLILGGDIGTAAAMATTSDINNVVVESSKSNSKTYELLSKIAKYTGTSIITIGSGLKNKIVDYAKRNPEKIVDVIEKIVKAPVTAILNNVSDNKLKRIIKTSLDEFFPMLRELVRDYEKTNPNLDKQVGGNDQCVIELYIP